MDATRQARLAANEAAARAENESRKDWLERGHPRVAFQCECFDPDCAEVVSVDADGYSDVRANPRRFIVAHGHVQPHVEVEVARFAEYTVVEKSTPAGIGVVAATDPRAGES
jgi:hypothetical protein